MALGFFVIILIGVTAFSKFPIVALFLGPLLYVYLTAGFFTVAQAWQKGEQVTFSRIFIGFQDSRLFKDLLPLYAAQVIYGILAGALPLLARFMPNPNPILTSLYVNTGYQVVVGAIYYFCFAFSLPLIVLKQVPFLKTISPSFRAVTQNFVPLLLVFVTTMLLLLVCIILLVAPAVFIAAPIMMLTPYVVYSTIFEDFKIVLPKKEAALEATP